MTQPASTFRARDLGTTVVLDDWKVDAWCTRVRFHLEEQPFPFTVSGAMLGPLRLQIPVSAPLPLVRVEPGETECSGWLVFGPLPEKADAFALVVNRLTVPPEGQPPDVHANPFLDPYEDERTPGMATAMEKVHGTNRAIVYELPPGWECTGRWAFHVAVRTRTPPCPQPLDTWIPVGRAAIRIPWIHRGKVGTLLALDYLPPRLAAQGAAWKAHAVAHLPEGELPEIGRVHFRLAVAVDGAEVEARHSGPFGVFQARHYLELPPLAEDAALRLLVQEMHGMPLDEPWHHTFEVRHWENADHFEFALAQLGFEGSGTFRLTDVYDDSSTLVVSYVMDTDAPQVSGAWPQDATLHDEAGYDYLCQGDGVHWISSHGTDEPVRGLLFASPEEGEAPLLLRIAAVDIAFREPLEILL